MTLKHIKNLKIKSFGLQVTSLSNMVEAGMTTHSIFCSDDPIAFESLFIISDDVMLRASVQQVSDRLCDAGTGNGMLAALENTLNAQELVDLVSDVTIFVCLQPCMYVH